MKPPADLVEAIEPVHYSLSRALPDDDVSVEFSRVAAKQSPSIDPVLLVYSFVAGMAMENAAAGLLFGEEIGEVSEKRLFMIQRINCHPKAQYMTIRNRDIESLQPGNYVNDIIVDFWSAWIMRKEVKSESVVCPMMTYFYTTLSSVGGVEQVLRWTEKMDIFSKQFIFVPVNQALHGLLCIVVNPGLITAFNDDDVDVEVPCLIFLDSLQLHSRKEIAEKLRTWLNAEWNRKHNVNDNLFTPITMGSFFPKGKFILFFFIVTILYVSLLNLKTYFYFHQHSTYAG
jgi:hypothetical protein